MIKAIETLKILMPVILVGYSWYYDILHALAMSMMFCLGFHLDIWHRNMREGIFKSKKEAAIAIIPVHLIIASIPLFMYLVASKRLGL